MADHRAGAGAAVTEGPGVGRDRPVAVGRGAAVERGGQPLHRRGERRRGQDVGSQHRDRVRDRAGAAAVVGDRQGDVVRARCGVGVARGRPGVGLTVPEVPGVRRDGAVDVLGRARVERRREVGRCGREAGRGSDVRARARAVVGGDLRRRELPRVDREVVERAREVAARRLARPRREVVAADPPVAPGSVEPVGHVGSRGDERAVHVELHARRRQGRRHVVPGVVAVGPRAGDRLAGAVVHAEEDVARVVHVDVAVVVARRRRLLVTEADQLAALRGAGLEPAVQGQRVQRCQLRRRVGDPVRGAVEAAGAVGVAGQAAAGVADARAGRHRVGADQVGCGGAAGLVEPPEVERLAVVHGLHVGAQAAGRPDGHRGPRAVGGVAEGVHGRDAVLVRRAGYQPGVGVAQCVAVPEAGRRRWSCRSVRPWSRRRGRPCR